MRLAIERLSIKKNPEPKDTSEGASATKRRIWEKQLDEYFRRGHHSKENMKSVYSLVWGQCSDLMRQKVEALGDLFAMST